jgi:alanine-synthesizing transaminase
MFSSRVPADLQCNPFSRVLTAARASGRDLIDLTVTNPTMCGFSYDPALLAPLSGASSLTYRPEPFGLPDARAAVSADYARRGIDVAPSRVVLTASTSEAYSLLFKLLCEPSGDAVMIPLPGYPLFDHLTRLDGIEAVPYRLEFHGQWGIDFASLDAHWHDRTRAVLAVSPHNPTGALLSPHELDALGERCAARDAAIVLDEVFADYLLCAAGDSAGTAATAALTFRLGGLSKSAGLPQVKLGWIAVDGPADLVDQALERLELICDTYLSVSTPVQVAAASLIDAGAALRQQILDRIRSNYKALRELAAAHPAIEALPVTGGWSAVLRVPSRATEEEIAIDLLRHAGVIVHPGFFFDFAAEAFLVVSLLPPTGRFREGIARVLERVDV